MKPFAPLFMALIASSAIQCLADIVPSLNITHGADQSRVAIPSILSIKYTDDAMVVTLKDGTQQTFSLDQITMMELGHTDTSIRRIVAQAGGDGHYVITDLYGRVIAQGNVGSDGQIPTPSMRGIYLLTIGSQITTILVQ